MNRTNFSFPLSFQHVVSSCLRGMNYSGYRMEQEGKVHFALLKNNMGEEKRKYPRIALNAFIRFYEGSPDNSARQGMIKNYSQGGVFVSTNRPLPKGSLMTLEIPIETGTSEMKIVEIRGVVRWIGNQGIGVEFFEFTESGLKDFAEWIRKFLG